MSLELGRFCRESPVPVPGIVFGGLIGGAIGVAIVALLFGGCSRKDANAALGIKPTGWDASFKPTDDGHGRIVEVRKDGKLVGRYFNYMYWDNGLVSLPLDEESAK